MKIFFLLLLFPVLAFGQVYDSAGFLKIRPVYRDTGSTKIIYRDTVIYRDTCFGSIPTSTLPVITFTPEIIPYSEPDVNAPGRGAEQWHNGSAAVGNLPQPMDVYHRFVWTRLEGPTQGSYNWTYFDGLVNAAIARKQKMSFGIMSCYPGGTPNEGLVSFPEGGYSAYPVYLHNLMKAESVKDWRTGNTWTPNYNSQHYLNRLLALHQALNKHIYEKGWEKVIQFIDVRGFGAWGEWNSAYTPNNKVSDYPAGTFPTVATFKKIVDTHTQGFPNFPLVAMIAAFDAQYLQNTWIPAEVGYYVLTTKNAWGLLGWRRDQWGARDAYLPAYLDRNNRTYNGVALKTLIMERWKYAPITGEPMPSGDPMDSLLSQVRLYHATSFGNGNYGAVTIQTATNVVAASKACGYRLQVKSGSIANGKITVTWENVGNAPTYENWDAVYELKDGDKVVWTGLSKFKAKLFLPGSVTVEDVYTNIPAGNYTLTIKLIDPSGYRDPLVLAMRNRNADGSYTLIRTL